MTIAGQLHWACAQKRGAGTPNVQLQPNRFFGHSTTLQLPRLAPQPLFQPPVATVVTALETALHCAFLAVQSCSSALQGSAGRLP